MIEWINALPWLPMLIASTLLFGIVLLLLLWINKYPSSRTLGVYLFSILLFPLSISFSIYYEVGWALLLLISFNVCYYTRSFFIQSVRFSFKNIIPLLVGLCLLLISHLLSFGDNGSILVRILIGVIILLYLLWAFKRFRLEGINRGINWSLNPGGRLKWFRNYLFLSTFLVIAWLFHEALPPSILLITILINITFVYLQVFKESAFLAPIQTNNKYQKSTLTPEQKYAILSKLDQLLTVDKFYLQSTVSLGGLAKSLNTTTHHLSQVINESKGYTFQELIGQYRIKESKKLLKDPSKSHLKIENIATMVGYNSKSAFNTAFKKYSGVTPTEFKASKDVLSYREEHRPERKRLLFGRFPVGLNHSSNIKITGFMISNFFKVLYRTMLKNKAFTILNLGGLIVGFICSILIYLFIIDEMSYDQELADSDQIFRVSWMSDNPQTRTPHPLAQAMVRDIPEVIQATSISPQYGPGLSKQSVRVKNVKERVFFEEPDFFFADSTFLDIFQLEVLEGDKEALSKPWNLVITEDMAKKYFGEQSAIGQKLDVNDNPLAVAAVVKGMPKNSHFHFNGIISYVTLKAIRPDNNWFTWDDFGHFNYIKLAKNADVTQIKAGMTEWVAPYLDWDQADLETLKSGGYYFDLQPINSIHLHSHLRWELENNGNILYIYILSGTLIFILLIIIVNYVNLTNAKSLERAREVGVRKTLGAFSGNLRWQFYLESFIFCFASLVLAFVITTLLLNSFNELTGKHFDINNLLDQWFIVKALIGCLLISFIAGIYPALTISSFIPSEVLKGKTPISFQGNRVREVLVVVQFFVSAILIIGSLIILKQIDYMQSKQLGFDQEAVISIKAPQSAAVGGVNLQAIKAAQEMIMKIPGVKNTSSTSSLPGGQYNQHRLFAKSNRENIIDVSEMFVDFGLTDLLNLEMVKGRSFNSTFQSDSAGRNVILNESAVQQLNLKNPIDEKIVWLDNNETHELTVVGVVKDFHFQSLHAAIEPLIILNDPYEISQVVIKLDGTNFQKSMEGIEKVYRLFDEEFPFEYQFLDDQLASLYQLEIQTLSVFSIFAGIALFLACLGLIGMALAILHQKIREIGIRKILGATTTQLIKMILNQFTKLIVISLLLGLPIGYLLLQNWLSEFSYQVSIGLLPFVLASIILLVVALMSVSLVVIRIAFSNPIDSIRYE